ncbi:MAG: hypothetical protein BroJett005_31370 [Ignavibacteriota bacterium]|nr:MAG: hypothetical protein BroJett005_31370 [Ignavibacteriota bacterium]
MDTPPSSPDSPKESLTLPIEMVNHIVTELHQIRLGVWFVSTVPFTISFLAAVVYLSLKGAISENITALLLLTPALPLLYPQQTPSIFAQLSRLFAPLSATSSEYPRSNPVEQQGDKPNG